MKYSEYPDPRDFLEITQKILEEQEALYGLMLGLSLTLKENLFLYGSQPLFGTVTNGDKLELALFMTPPRKIQIAAFGDQLGRSIPLAASKLYQRKWPLPAVLAEERAARSFATAWEKLAGCKCEPGMRQRIYELRKVIHPTYPPGRLRLARTEDLDLVQQWTLGFHEECFPGEDHSYSVDKLALSMVEGGRLYLWEDSSPLSMAALRRPTAHGISVSYVYTPKSLRKKGYASAIVAKISQLALDEGYDFCVLYTDLANPTSNSIYQKIGYVPVADVMDINFVVPLPEEKGGEFPR